MMGSKSDQFINDLVQFYRNKGHNNPQPQQFIARINGKVVDLNQLYLYVIESGGSFKVNQLNLWDEIYCKLFKTNVVGANISVALRQIYNRYLLPYEKVFSTNFNNDLLDDDEDESNFSFNSSHNYNHNHSFNSQSSSVSIPLLSYQLSQSVSTSNNTESRNPLNKLFCSLLSGLPNELDFAFKVSTILINSNRFDWNCDHKFVDLLLECSKNYCCVCDHQNVSVLQDFDFDSTDFFTNEEQNLCNCYQRFWYQCCSDEQTLELVFGPFDPSIEQLPEQDFNKIEEKVRLIGDIIRNLSFTYDSDSEAGLSPSSVASTLLMKFLLLLSNSSLQPFNFIAFDIISNIAAITAVVTEDNDYKQIQQSLHRRCVQIAMTSNDIHWTTRSLEIISRLLSSNNEEMTSFIESQLRDYEVFIRITHLMTCQYDISLLLAILEFCLSVSQQKPYLLVREDNKHLIKMLLTLLNCEASQHFTTSALKKMRVIDDRPRTQTNPSTESSGQTVSVVTSGGNTSQTTNLDNETFAMNWLRSAFEPNVNLSETQSTLKASDVYADYVKQCCRSSRRNVMAAQPFSQLIKRCFPSSSLTNNQTTIEGIVAKSVQNIQNKSNGIPVPQLMSPILKAHLSAPPKNSSSTTPTVNSNTNSNTNLIINNNNTTNTTSVQSIGSTTCVTLSPNSLSIPTTNTSTLIKSLLANKLRSNATITTSNASLGTILTTTTTVTPPTSTTVTPTKSTNNMSVKVTPVAKPVPITNSAVNTNNSGNSEINGESIGNNSPQLPSAITITPSVCSVSLTPNNNTIISSNATITGHTVQPQQQFLLVRTIITSPGQQQSGSSLTTSGTPVRLILPASMLTQQRLNPATVNGITTTSNTITNVTLSASNSLMANSSSTTVSSNTSDIFLKTVLSNSNSSTHSVSPLRSNVKSSPLLNVLLDKGKLPEFSTTSVLNNQMTAIGNSGAPKMYILTTKSPLAIKSLPNLQTQQLNQTTQCIPQTQLSPVCSLQTQNSTTLKACLQNSSVVMATTSVNSITVTTTTTSNHTVVKHSPSKQSAPPLVNGDIGPVVHSTNVVNSVIPINNNTNSVSANNAVNCVSDSKCEQTVNNTLNAINNIIPSSDLSSFKEIKKAVDDATRLLAKRPNEAADPIGANKKIKINSVLTIPSSGLSAQNSIPNHDSNSDSNCIANNSTNSLQQVLTKASNLSTVSTTPSTLATTITTITSNNIKSVCNTNNIINKENNSSVNCEFECQWNDCKKTFSRASEVFLHVHNHHIMPSTFPNIMTCLWGGQEGTGPGCLSKRPKFSLLTHLLDFHCNPNVLQQESVRKKQLSSVGSTTIVLPQPPAHPGYAHNAALLAIKRHATNYVEAPTLPPVNELTPLTVSIRLTCALILRNLTLHSNFVKRTLECFEQYLCELCMSDGRDESRTIAQCLALINDKT